jgi:serine/threonine protein kinase
MGFVSYCTGLPPPHTPTHTHLQDNILLVNGNEACGTTGENSSPLCFPFVAHFLSLLVDPCQRGEELHVKLVDFGISKMLAFRGAAAAGGGIEKVHNARPTMKRTKSREFSRECRRTGSGEVAWELRQERSVSGGGISRTRSASTQPTAKGASVNMKPRLRRTFTQCGSECYIAPEVVAGNGYGTKVDVWSAGVTMLVMLSGCLPDTSMMYDQEYQDELLTMLHDDMVGTGRFSPAAFDLLRRMVKINPRYAISRCNRYAFITLLCLFV